MGIGNKLFTMPGEAIKFFATESKLILNVEKEKLKTAPRLEKGDKWPDFSDALWGERIYYDYVPLEVVGSTIRGDFQTDPLWDGQRPKAIETSFP